MKSLKTVALLFAMGIIGTVCADKVEPVGESKEQFYDLVNGLRDIAYDCDKMSESEFRQKKDELIKAHAGATSKQLFEAFDLSLNRRRAENIANNRFVKTKCEVCKIVAEDFKAAREYYEEKSWEESCVKNQGK